MDFNDYFSSLRNKTCAVIGLGISNLPLVKLLSEAGAKIIACDGDKNAVKPDGVFEFRLGDGYLDGLDADVIFRTPGVLPETPEIVNAVRRGAVLTSEMEAFFELCPCRIIGVTGSDGKTTTTTLISKILAASGTTCHLGGNIGRPLLSDIPVIKQSDIAVVELSSFQLASMTRSPDIAVVTNISPNHLDKHGTMEKYVEAKMNIFLHQTKTGVLVYNDDCEITKGFGALAPGGAVPFGRGDGGFGVRCSDFIRRDGEKVLDPAEIKIPGGHNVENYMAAIAAVEGLAGDAHIRRVAREFGGVEHRLELVRERGGVKWYNGSIDTSPSRTAAALSVFEKPVVLICGGYDKKIPYQPMAPAVTDHVKLLITLGKTGPLIIKAVKESPAYDPSRIKIIETENLAQAVAAADENTSDGDTVLLSPASASFGMFKNFEERGLAFKKFVKELP